MVATTSPITVAAKVVTMIKVRRLNRERSQGSMEATASDSTSGQIGN